MLGVLRPPASWAPPDQSARGACVVAAGRQAHLVGVGPLQRLGQHDPPAVVTPLAEAGAVLRGRRGRRAVPAGQQLLDARGAGDGRQRVLHVHAGQPLRGTGGHVVGGRDIARHGHLQRRVDVDRPVRVHGSRALDALLHVALPVRLPVQECRLLARRAHRAQRLVTVTGREQHGAGVPERVHFDGEVVDVGIVPIQPERDHRAVVHGPHRDLRHHRRRPVRQRDRLGVHHHGGRGGPAPVARGRVVGRGLVHAGDPYLAGGDGIGRVRIADAAGQGQGAGPGQAAGQQVAAGEPVRSGCRLGHGWLLR